MQILKTTIVIILLVLCQPGRSTAQQQTATKPPQSRFSHKGLKIMLASTTQGVIAERNLRDGEGAILGLGFGFSRHSSLWLHLLNAEHVRNDAAAEVAEYTAAEISLQYKFDPQTPLQPYARVGVGAYRLSGPPLGQRLLGAGICIAGGVDFFFSRHFGVGAEVTLKKIDYYVEQTRTSQTNILTDLSPNLNADTMAFSLTLTVQ
jgi:hypothetical protein